MFIIALNVLLMFQFILIAISIVSQSMFLIKASILVFTIAVDCVMISGNIKKIYLLAPKRSRNSDNMNILSFFFIFLLSFNILRKRKNDPRRKITLTSIAFLVCILYRFSKLHNKLKSCFNFPIFYP